MKVDHLLHILDHIYRLLSDFIKSIKIAKDLQSLAEKLVVSVSKIRKLAVVFLFDKIQKLILHMVLKT